MWSLLLIIFCIYGTFECRRAALVGTPYSVTVVSGYWLIDSKASNSEYKTWMLNVLRINAPLVFFYWTDSILKEVEKIRVGYPTYYFKLNISDFTFENFYKPQWIHPIHIPSQELGKIWLEKIYLMERSMKVNPFHSEWFAWMDAGNAYYRSKIVPPFRWPDPNILGNLPKNKIIHTTSESYTSSVHTFAGTAFAMHRTFVSSVAEDFRQALYSCSIVTKVGNHIMEGYECCSDQYIFSIMKEKNSSMFHNLAPNEQGYGTLIPLLGFSKFDRVSSSNISLRMLTNLKSARSSKKISVMTMVSSDEYVKGANALYYSLVAHWDATLLGQTSFVALVVDSHENKYIYSHLQGWSIVSVPLITPPYDGAVTFDRFKEQFTKLHLWKMTSYSRILYLDSDVLCLRDPSDMLKHTILPFGAVLDWEQGAIKDHFNMGVFTIKPDKKEFKRLDDLRVRERGLAEQGLINHVYRNHSHIHLFPFTFNGNLAAAVQDKKFWDKHYARLRILHYTWLKPFHSNAKVQCGDNESCLKAIELWENWFACVPE